MADTEAWTVTNATDNLTVTVWLRRSPNKMGREPIAAVAPKASAQITLSTADVDSGEPVLFLQTAPGPLLEPDFCCHHMWVPLDSTAASAPTPCGDSAAVDSDTKTITVSVDPAAAAQDCGPGCGTPDCCRRCTSGAGSYAVDNSTDATLNLFYATRAQGASDVLPDSVFSVAPGKTATLTVGSPLVSLRDAGAPPDSTTTAGFFVAFSEFPLAVGDSYCPSRSFVQRYPGETRTVAGPTITVSEGSILASGAVNPGQLCVPSNACAPGVPTAKVIAAVLGVLAFVLIVAAIGIGASRGKK